MATTVQNIFNMALSHVGEDYFIEESDVATNATREAQLCNTFIQSAIDFVEEAVDWKHMIFIDDLTQKKIEFLPNFYCYRLGEMAKRVLSVTSLSYPKIWGAEFEVITDPNNIGAGQIIVSRKELALMRYVARRNSIVNAPQVFVDAVSLKLASMIAGSLVKGAQGIQIAQACDAKFANLIQQYIPQVDAQAAQFEKQIPDWLKARQ